MNYGLYVSASGMMTQIARQDVIANNLANVATTAFKPDSIFIRQRDTARVEDGLSFLPSDDLLERLGGGVMPTPTFVGSSPGALELTGRPLDLGIDGEGFLVARAGPGEEGLRLTRDGRLAISANGALITASEGHPVLDTRNRPITLNPSHEVTIDASGVITQQGVTRGRLQLASVAEPGRLVKAGGGLLKAARGEALDRQPAGGSIQQNHLERSTVNAVQSLMDAESAARGAQGHARLIGYYDELMTLAIGRLGRVS